MLPLGVKAHRAATAFANRRLRTADHGVAPDAWADTHQTLLAPAAHTLDAIALLGVNIVVKHHARQSAGRVYLGNICCRGAQLRRRPVEGFKRHLQRHALRLHVILRLQSGNALQRKHLRGLIAAGPTQAQFSQILRIGPQLSVAHLKRHQLPCSGLIESDVKVKRLNLSRKSRS